jgi:hypothetical protein
MHEHKPVTDRWRNLLCDTCGKIFVRNKPYIPDYIEFRTDAYRDI